MKEENRGRVGAGGPFTLFVLSFIIVLAPLSSGEELTFTYFSGYPPPGFVDAPGTAARLQAAGIALDSAGNIYASDDCVIRKITPDGFVTTLAGRVGECGTADGPAWQARLDPWYIAADPAGRVYFSDTGNHVIRVITPDGFVRTLAGMAGNPGSADGFGGDARFGSPRGLAFANGNLYVADGNGIRLVTPNGAVSTLPPRLNFYEFIAVDNRGNLYATKNSWAGCAIDRFNGHGDYVGTIYAGLPYTAGLANDPSGLLYVSSPYYHSIKRFEPDGTSGTTFVGTFGWSDGTGTAAGFVGPAGVAADSSGNLFVADGSAIRKATPEGVVTTVAGLLAAPAVLPYGYDGIEGSATEARFGATAMAFDASGRLLLADNDLVWSVDSDGSVSLVAGKRNARWEADGIGRNALFYDVQAVAADGLGNAYVCEYQGRTIRKIAPGGVVTTLAGQFGAAASSVDGVGSAARFMTPYGIASTRDGTLYVADVDATVIRKITPAGAVTTLAGKAGSPGAIDGAGSEARFRHPEAVVLDDVGNLFVADDHAIRKVTPEGVVTTFAGRPGEAGSSDGPAAEARFEFISGLTFDMSGDLLVSGWWLRRVGRDGTVSTIQWPGAGAVAEDRTGRLIGFSAGTLYRAVPTLDDRATVTPAMAPVGVPRTLSTAPATATAWTWTVLQRPPGSIAALSSTTAKSPTFIPDAPGRYVLGLSATDGTRVRVSQVDVIAADGYPEDLLLSTGRISVTLDWKSRYDGRSGRAHATPLGGAYGFFWFDDPDTPEVFVKVVDFGVPESLIVFWGGLTDFEYTVRFTNLASGDTVVGRHPAFGLDGGASRLSRTPPSTSSPPVAGVTAADRALEASDTSSLPGPFSTGDITVSVSWRSQWSGTSGVAVPLSSSGSLAYFYFSTSENPEVFVKVLDWGPDRPYLLFWTGLTDFEYTVTFRNVRTGQAVSFVKPAGEVGGGWDVTSLLH